MDFSCVCDSNGHRLKFMLLPSETERWIDVSVTIGIRHLIWSAPPSFAVEDSRLRGGALVVWC